MELQQNEKPSIFKNIGEDILGATRHREFTRGELQEKQLKKEINERTKSIKEKYQALLSSPDFLDQSYEFIQKSLENYELAIACAKINFTADSGQALRSYIVANKTKNNALAFNHYLRKSREHRLDLRSAVLKNELSKYIASFFKPKEKNSYYENNGKTVNWHNEVNEMSVSNYNFLTNKIKALQLGNSLLDTERAYVINNLVEQLNIFETNFSFNLDAINFSFGSRGRPTSVAHYEPSSETIAINRGIDGALIHEIGHAIDHKLKNVSYNLPRVVISSYQKKLDPLKLPYSHRKYLLKYTEIFARLFESYCYKKGIFSSFSLFINEWAVMPDLCEESEKFIEDCLLKLKGN